MQTHDHDNWQRLQGQARLPTAYLWGWVGGGACRMGAASGIEFAPLMDRARCAIRHGALLSLAVEHERSVRWRMIPSDQQFRHTFRFMTRRVPDDIGVALAT